MARFIDRMFVGKSSEEVVAELESLGLLDKLFEEYSVDDFRPNGQVFLGDPYSDYFGIWFDKDGVCMDCEWMM